MPSPLVLFLSQRDDISSDEIAALDGLIVKTQDVAAGSAMIRQGDRPKTSILMLQGFSARAHYLANGKRMISALHVPGDYVDLHSLLLDQLDHDVVALTDCRIALTSHVDLKRITEKMPHLGRLLWLSTTIDAALHRAWIVALGRMSPLSHLAHFLCEIYMRLGVVNLTQEFSYRLPITQIDLADMLGLSVVHVNRTLQELRSTGLVSWNGQAVVIHDWDGLRAIAQFDASYLQLQKAPR